MRIVFIRHVQCFQICLNIHASFEIKGWSHVFLVANWLFYAYFSIKALDIIVVFIMALDSVCEGEFCACHGYMDMVIV